MLLDSTNNAYNYTFSGTEELWSQLFKDKGEVTAAEVQSASSSGVSNGMEKYDALGDQDGNLDKAEFLLCRDPIEVPIESEVLTLSNTTTAPVESEVLPLSDTTTAPSTPTEDFSYKIAEADAEFAEDAAAEEAAAAAAELAFADDQ
eukprot:tig00000114_g6036.t1